MQRFDKAIYLSFIFKFILSVRLSNDHMFYYFLIHNSEFINTISIFMIPLLNSLYCYIRF